MSRYVGRLLHSAVILGTMAVACSCTTRETGFIDLAVASVAPPAKVPKEPPRCTMDSECTDPKRPRCSSQGSCVACIVDDDCGDPGKPRCFVERPESGITTMPAPPPMYTCVECSSDVDCKRDPARARCAALRGKCVACTIDSDCAADERCEPDGTCRRLSGGDGG